jgi:drug/metabolite transporter (DMT)-like permease
MKSGLLARQYAVLGAVVVLGVSGDVALKRGMKDFASISLSNWETIFVALASPWVVLGIVLLIGFMSTYLTALSWADLSFVLPATSAVGYLLTVGLSRFFLHEAVTPKRWLGVVLISIGVGFIATGSHATSPEFQKAALPKNSVPENFS